jgi:acyl-CoA thioester hydrolase
MKHYDFDVRIAYADTDRMGVVYYANYLVLFERGRTEFLRAAGLRYRDMEDQDKIFMPVVEAECRYFAPGRYDDLITVRTFLAEMGGAHVRFDHEIYLTGSDKKIAEGFTRHAIVGPSWKPTRFPMSLREHLRPHVKT